MRVALISPLFESVPPRLYGGTERVVANLCQGLTDQNIEVVLFASGDSASEGKLIAVTQEALRHRVPPVSDPHAYQLKMLSMVARSANEFDLIHNHNDYWMLPLSQMCSTPMLTTLHGRLDGFDSPAAFYSYQKSNFVSISDAQRTPLSELNWMKTIYHGLDLNRFPFYPKPGQYLAFLGRICEEKRPDWAIAIAKKAGIPLKIAAKIEPGSSQQYFDERIKPHLDGKWVEFVGEISESEKPEFLGNALALVFPIDWPEPFGLVMIESLAVGTPVLARPLGSVPEITRDGVTGFSDLSLKSLADCVQTIHLLDRKKCRHWVEQNFSLQKMTQEYLDVYRQIISKARGSHSHRRDLLYPLQRTSLWNSED